MRPAFTTDRGLGSALYRLDVQIRSPHVTHANATCTHNGPGRERSTHRTEGCSCPAGVRSAWLYDAAKDWKLIRCSTYGQSHLHPLRARVSPGEVASINPRHQVKPIVTILTPFFIFTP